MLDAALLHEVIVGYDLSDFMFILWSAVFVVVVVIEGACGDLRGLWVGVVCEFGGEGY